MGDFYHGRRIHYSGGSFKMRARSKSEVKSYNNSEVGLESDGGSKRYSPGAHKSRLH